MEVKLVMFKKNGSRRIFPLPSSITVIGRRHDCDLCVPVMSVSRRHCQLNYDDGALNIRDLGSHNGTYLNGKRINEAVIKAGDSIEVGPLTFIFQIDGQPETIVQPDWVGQNQLQQDMPVDKAADEQFDDFEGLDDLDSLTDGAADEQFDDFTELDDLDSLEETDST